MAGESGSMDVTFNLLVDSVTSPKPAPVVSSVPADVQIIQLLRELVNGQQRQNELLQRMIEQSNAAQQARVNELNAWRAAHPNLAQACHDSMASLGRAQATVLQELTEELQDSGEQIEESPYLMAEFIDRYGPRMAHLNCLLQMVGQLGQTSGSSDPQSDQ